MDMTGTINAMTVCRHDRDDPPPMFLYPDTAQGCPGPGRACPTPQTSLLREYPHSSPRDGVLPEGDGPYFLHTAIRSVDESPASLSSVKSLRERPLYPFPSLMLINL